MTNNTLVSPFPHECTIILHPLPRQSVNLHRNQLLLLAPVQHARLYTPPHPHPTPTYLTYHTCQSHEWLQHTSQDVLPVTCSLFLLLSFGGSLEIFVLKLLFSDWFLLLWPPHLLLFLRRHTSTSIDHHLIFLLSFWTYCTLLFVCCICAHSTPVSHAQGSTLASTSTSELCLFTLIFLLHYHFFLTPATFNRIYQRFCHWVCTPTLCRFIFIFQTHQSLYVSASWTSATNTKQWRKCQFVYLNTALMCVVGVCWTGLVTN